MSTLEDFNKDIYPVIGFTNLMAMIKFAGMVTIAFVYQFKVNFDVIIVLVVAVEKFLSPLPLFSFLLRACFSR